MAGNVGKLAPRYARALLMAMRREAADEVALRRAASAIDEFARSWQATKEMRDYFLNPMFRRADRAQVMCQSLRTAGAPEIVVNFLNLLFVRERLNSDSIVAIADAFISAVDKECSVVRVEVVTANEVAEDEKQSIVASLARAISGRLEPSWAVDSSLLGGLVVRYQGKVLDGSLKGRVDRLESSLMR